MIGDLCAFRKKRCTLHSIPVWSFKIKETSLSKSVWIQHAIFRRNMTVFLWLTTDSLLTSHHYYYYYFLTKAETQRLDSDQVAGARQVKAMYIMLQAARPTPRQTADLIYDSCTLDCCFVPLIKHACILMYHWHVDICLWLRSCFFFFFFNVSSHPPASHRVNGDSDYLVHISVPAQLCPRNQ